MFDFAPSEIILSLLLSSYSFELTGKPVMWNQSGIVYPTMGPESVQPELRLKIKTLKA